MNKVVILLTIGFSIFLTGCTSIGSYVIKHPGVYLSEAEFISKKPEEMGFEQDEHCIENSDLCLQYLFADAYSFTDKAVSYNLHASSNGIETKVSHTMTPDTFNRYRGTAILLHGYGGNKKVLIATAIYFRALGMKVIVPDLFGHGQSKQPFQFAAKEHEVLSDLLNSMKSDEPVLVVGHSMGALPATQLLTSDQVNAGILLAPMMRFDLAAKKYLPYKSPFMASIFSSSLDDIVVNSMRSANVELAETDVLTLIKQGDKSTLLVTSDLDPVSPTEYFAAIENPNIHQVTWLGRNHSSLMLFDKADATMIEAWLDGLGDFKQLVEQ